MFHRKPLPNRHDEHGRPVTGDGGLRVAAAVRVHHAFSLPSRPSQFSDFLNAAGVEEDVVNKIVDRLSALERPDPQADRKNLGPGFEIGHSFFCPGDDDEGLDDSWYEAIIRREIEPLLRNTGSTVPSIVRGTNRRVLLA